MPTPTPRRPARPQTVLRVLATERLSPHLVRLRIGGDGFDAYQHNAFTDRYVKIVFARPELELEPPYDLAALRETLAPQDLPVTRTYTIRRADLEQRFLDLDFVVHGDEGIAGPWAASAQPGERVVFAGPGGGYSPDPSYGRHLLVGDESALPAIAAALEALPAQASGHALIETHGEDDRIALTAPAGVDIRWIYRDGRTPGQTTELLAQAVEQLDWPDNDVHAFVHGERESVKRLRDVLIKGRGLERRQLSISGYWAHGRSEDRFQAEKREPIGEILPREA